MPPARTDRFRPALGRVEGQSKTSPAAYCSVIASVSVYLACVAYDVQWLYFLAVLGLVVVALCAVKIEWGLLAVPIVLTNPVGLPETGTNLILSEYVLLIILSMYFVKMCTLKEAYVFPKRFLYPSLAVVGAAGLSLVSTSYFMASVQQIVRHVEVMLILVFVIVNVCKTEESVKRMVVSLVAGGCIASLIGVTQFVTNSLGSGRSERVYGMLGGGFGAIMSATLLFCVALLVYDDSRWNKVLALVTIPPAGTALLLSQTRAWIGAFILVGAYALLVGKKGVRRKSLLVLGAIALIVTAVLSTDLFGLVEHNILLTAVYSAFRFGRRLGEYSTEDISVFSRFIVWGYALTQFLQHPLFGVGIGNLRFISYIPLRLGPPVAGSGYVDNQYIQTFTELGVIGGVGWILYLFRAIRTSHSNFVEARNPGLRACALGMHVSLLVFAIGSLFWVVTPSHELFALMVIFVALSVSVDRILMSSGPLVRGA